MSSIRMIVCLTVAASLVIGHAEAQDPIPAAPPTPTLWSFLGVPQGMKKVRGALTNRKGENPKREPKDALKALADPANLKSPDPAIKEAAKIKKEEDLKPQKIKAIKYLASIGCGCYDKEGKVTAALIAKAEDCTEDVRLVTMQSIHEAATGKCCNHCGIVCCCNEKMMKKLAEIAYDKDETGCWVEPSARVRAAAEKALKACCPGGLPLEITTEETTKPKPDPGIDPEKKNQEGVEGEAKKREEITTVPKVDRIQVRIGDQPSSPNQNVSFRKPKARPGIAEMRQLASTQARGIVSSPNPEGGVVMAYDASHQIAYVHFEDQNTLVSVGTIIYVRPDSAIDEEGFHGVWRVIESDAGCANLTPAGDDLECVAVVGDHVFIGSPEVLVGP